MEKFKKKVKKNEKRGNQGDYECREKVRGKMGMKVIEKKERRRMQ